MEDQNNATAAAPAAVVAENGSSVTNATQEVTSTTQAIADTKRSLRVQTWKKIQQNKCGIGFNAIFNRIPGFVDSDKAGSLLAETEEFKKAEHVKVNIDRALHAIKLQTLVTGKTLYLPATRDSAALFLKVDVPADATEEQKKEILHVQDVQQHRTEVGLGTKVKFDLVVIGSVLVSREGYRIGRGNGFADLDIGVLIELGCITPETVIVTMVHDLQVVDSLPKHLFQKYDTPVDIIVTPTEVIRVEKALPRPTGIFWEILSERRLQIVPVLKSIKEIEEKAGKVIVLKEEDTDIEANINRSRRRGPPRRRFGRKNQRRAASQTDTEQQGAENVPQKRNPRRNRRFTNRRRRPTKSEGDQSAVEGKSQERKSGGDRKQRQRKNRQTRDFCVKLSNINREIRVKDLKTELRKRECNPLYISWKGHFGKCYLHFGNRNGTPSTEDDINKVLESLNDLSLTITTGGSNAAATAAATGNGSGGEGDADAVAAPVADQPKETKTINISVELIKFDENKAAVADVNGDVAAGGDAEAEAGAGRIESVDTTTV